MSAWFGLRGWSFPPPGHCSACCCVRCRGIKTSWRCSGMCSPSVRTATHEASSTVQSISSQRSTQLIMSFSTVWQTPFEHATFVVWCSSRLEAGFAFVLAALSWQCRASALSARPLVVPSHRPVSYERACCVLVHTFLSSAFFIHECALASPTEAHRRISSRRTCGSRRFASGSTDTRSRCTMRWRTSRP